MQVYFSILSVISGMMAMAVGIGTELISMVVTANASGMTLYFATVAVAFAFGLYLLWRLSIRETAEHQPHEAYVPLPQSAMLADEATLYGDDESIVWETLVNSGEEKARSN